MFSSLPEDQLNITIGMHQLVRKGVKVRAKLNEFTCKCPFWFLEEKFISLSKNECSNPHIPQ